jgi:hypothetical protein
VDHFATPPEGPTVGVTTASKLVAQRLDADHLVADQFGEPGLLVSSGQGGRYARQARGVVTLVVWALSALVAVRLRHRPLTRLHAVIAAGLGLAVIVVARIFGTVWYYLMIWIWGIGAVMLVAIGWTAAAVIASRLDAERHRVWPRTGVAALVAVTAVVSVVFSIAAPDEPLPDAALSASLARLLPDTVDGLDAGAGPATGHDGRYLVTWTDAAYLGSQGYGLVNELERRGFDVGVIAGLKGTATFHRVLDPSQATARVNLATGIWVERWRDVEDAVELAEDDPRTPAERREFERLRDAVIAELRADGLDELVPRVDDSLFGLAIDERISASVQEKVTEMLRIGVPVAVFVAGPESEP